VKRTSVDHAFVDFMPSELVEGTLYLSIELAIAVHLCACGCGNKVVTPISPAEWQLIFDGDSVSLTPSIGNWEFPCRSHYWIKNDKVRWATAWTNEQVAASRQRDAWDVEDYFAHRKQPVAPDLEVAEAPSSAQRVTLLRRIRQWFRR